MAADVGPPLLVFRNDESLDEDDLERQEEDLPEDLLEDSEAETEQDEEGEDGASTVSCSPPEGDAWSSGSSHSTVGGEQREVTSGVPVVEECDQMPHSGPWAAEERVGVPHGPRDGVCVDERVQVLENELQSLTVLYMTRGKKVEELSSALQAAVEEGERCGRVHSHQQSEWQVESAGLRDELDQLKGSAVRMAEENVSLSRQLEEVQRVAAQTVEERDEVQRQLQSAECAVSSLQRQLEEVLGGDTLRQLREQYEAMLAAVKEQHSAEVLQLQQELDRRNGEQRTRVEQQGEEEGRGQQQGEEEGRVPSMPASFLVGLPMGGGDDYRQLVAECEDLRSAVSRAAEEREGLSGKLEAAEATCQRQQSLVSQLEVEVCRLRTELASVEGRWREEEGRLAKEKKVALEECRSQCLQLHDQSTSRLKNAFEAEKRFLLDECQRQTDSLKTELEAVQSKCSSLSEQSAATPSIPQHSCCSVAVQSCPHSSGLVEEAEFKRRVEAEVESARVAWRESLLDSTESAVTEALRKVEVEFACKLEREKDAVEERVRSDCAEDKQQALAFLREELAAASAVRQTGLSVAVQTVVNWEGVVGEAVERAREQCEDGWSREEAALRAELEQRHGQDLKEAVRRALEKAKAHYEGVVAHVRSKLAAEQRGLMGQQAAEQEALRRQVAALEDRLHQEQLWRRELQTSVLDLQHHLRSDLSTWMVQVLRSRQ